MEFYFDGEKAAAWNPGTLETGSYYGMHLGVDVYGNDQLRGAFDELYIYESALSEDAIAVLYGSVSAAPTASPPP